MQDINKLLQQITILESNQHYRVGDIINRMGIERSENSRVQILHQEQFKGSILRDYLNEISTDEFKKIPLSKTQSCKKFHPFTGKFIDHSKEKNYKLLGAIVKKQSGQYPWPSSRELCINLRAGDVLAANAKAKGGLRGKGSLYLLKENQEEDTLIRLIQKKLIKYKKINCITFVTAMHFGDHPWAKIFKYNKEKELENIKLYDQLFSSIASSFPSIRLKLLDLNSFSGYRKIDYQICYLCGARHLILDTGGFSKQIELIRNELINK